MLTLTRKVGETIRIGHDTEIAVKEIRRNQVRIGIAAPRDVPIYREEIYESLDVDPLDTMLSDVLFLLLKDSWKGTITETQQKAIKRLRNRYYPRADEQDFVEFILHQIEYAKTEDTA